MNAFHHMYLSLTKWRVSATNRMIYNNGKRNKNISEESGREYCFVFAEITVSVL